ncbi:uncharacterized protein [Musca autumnalis]|uniref:uncharacterized protein n=1 Tax=Musca autumnalis TaxID=221902 RepID=UPI003CF670A9
MLGNEDCPDSFQFEAMADSNSASGETMQNVNDRSIDLTTTLEDEINDILQPENESSGKKSNDRSTPAKRQKRDNTCKEDFLSIAKTQADAMLILANAQKDVANAMVKISENFTFLGGILSAQKRIENGISRIEQCLNGIGN